MQRCLVISVHLDDLDAGLGRCVGSLLRNVQRGRRNGDLILGVVHHITAGSADLLIAVLALRQILEHCLTVCTGGHVSHLFTIGIK